MAGGEKKLMGCDVWIRLQTLRESGVSRGFIEHITARKRTNVSLLNDKYHYNNKIHSLCLGEYSGTVMDARVHYR